MDLFEYAKSKTLDQESPLASRLRPRTLDEVVGQQHIVGKDKLLYRAIKADKLTSVIFYGPPGTGKTTLQKSSPIPQAQLYPDQCNRSREERYGSSCKAGTGRSRHVWEKDHSVY